MCCFLLCQRYRIRTLTSLGGYIAINYALGHLPASLVSGLLFTLTGAALDLMPYGRRRWALGPWVQ